MGILGLPAVEQQEGSFKITSTEDTISVAWTDPTGEELWKVVMHNTGSIKQIVISEFPILPEPGIGWHIEPGDWHQTWNFEPERNPVITEEENYVVVTFSSKGSTNPVSAVTNITICSNGIVFFDSILKFNENAPNAKFIGINIRGLPVDEWIGESIYYGTPKGIKIQKLETTETTGDFIWYTDMVYWTDWSKELIGMTIICLNPADFSTLFRCSDTRAWGGNDYQVRWAPYLWGAHAFRKDEKYPAHFAIYIHGEGGYQAYLDTINFLVNLGLARDTAAKAPEAYKDQTAKSIAAQALPKINSAFEKVYVNDIEGASALLEEANSILKQAADAEQMAIIKYDLMTLGIVALPIVALIVLAIIKRFLSRKK